MTQSQPNEVFEEPPILAQFVCGDCGALCDAGRVRCWMCGADIAGLGSKEMNPYAARSSSEVSSRSMDRPVAGSQYDLIFTLLLIGCLVLAIIVGIGMAAEDPGALVGYLILIGPAFIVTGVRALWQVGETGKTQPGRLLISLFVSFSITVAILALLALAAIIFLFVLCFWQITN